MLYRLIFQLEKTYNFYNKKALSVDFLLKWLESLNITSIPDKDIRTALSFITPKNNKVVVYNPHLHPDQLVVTLGHELGHWLLGHIECAQTLYDTSNLFATSGIEKDAGIIGFLCWYPTMTLDFIVQERGYLDIEEIAWEISNCDTEWALLRELMKARVRIYRAWKRIQQNYKLLNY